MDDPQIWTLIGVFAAIMLGVLQWSIMSLRREMVAGFATINARFEARCDGLDAKIDDRYNALDAKIDDRYNTLDAKIDDRFHRTMELMQARFDDVDHRLAAVESDMTLVKGHLLGQRSARDSA